MSGNTLNEQSWAAKKKRSFSLGLVEGLTTSDHQNGHFIKCHNGVVPGHIFGPPEQWNLVDGCETRSVTLREHSLCFSENRVLKKVLGPERGKVTGNKNEETMKSNDFGSYQILLRRRIKEDEMGGECGTFGEEYKSKWGLVRKPGFEDIGLDRKIILKPVLKN